MTRDSMAAAAGSVKKSEPMFFVEDMRATVRWYRSIGFTVSDEFEDHDRELVFARLSFGNAAFTLSPGEHAGPRNVSLWLFTDRVEELYRILKEGDVEVPFEEELYEPFYGGRQFSIRDLNGLTLVFWDPERG